MSAATSSLNVWMPTSNCSAPGGNLAMTSRNDSGSRSGIISKWIKMAGLIAREEEFEDGPAGGDVEIERAVNELELLHAAVEEPLHFAEEFVQRNLPDGDVERRQAELAGERTAARRLDVNDAMREVVVGVKVVGQGDLGKVGQFGGNDFGQRSAGHLSRRVS